MKIEFKKNVLIFMPKNKKEEKEIEKMRSCFENNNFKTDRCWNEEQEENNQPLGTRIYLK